MTETELLFSEIFNCERLSLYTQGLFLNKKRSLFISSVLKRRALGEPLQYILGKTEFMGLEFKLTPDVFIPRPETEILVEMVLNIVRRLAGPPVSGLKILDIGTGSGCIGVSLATFLPCVRITATDISKRALDIAKENAKINNVTDRINFIHSNLFTSYELRVTSYDIIVSNPPYISTSGIESLQPEVKYEPKIALDAGIDGLAFYRRIISASGRYLKKGGFLIMEMGFNQREGIENIFQKYKNFAIMEIIKDYNDIDRVMVIKKAR